MTRCNKTVRRRRGRKLNAFLLKCLLECFWIQKSDGSHILCNITATQSPGASWKTLQSNKRCWNTASVNTRHWRSAALRRQNTFIKFCKVEIKKNKVTNKQKGSPPEANAGSFWNEEADRIKPQNLDEAKNGQRHKEQVAAGNPC